jgi:PKHD-type hydroxylase
MREYIIRPVLNDEELKALHELISRSTMWMDGHDSSPWGDEVRQTNLEMDFKEPNHPIINSIVMNSIDRDHLFRSFTWATSSDRVIVSKYKTGTWLKIHEDAPTNGNFTTTIFLDDPSTYEGGELCLLINGKEEKIKLPAGQAITYNTGLIHRVSEVTKGERKVIVFWSRGKNQDRFLVDLYCDIDKLSRLYMKTLEDNNIKIEVNKHDLIETFNDPQNLFLSILNRMERKFVW